MHIDVRHYDVTGGFGQTGGFQRWPTVVSSLVFDQGAMYVLQSSQMQHAFVSTKIWKTQMDVDHSDRSNSFIGPARVIQSINFQSIEE